MIIKVSPERKDRYIQVIMDNLCRVQEENDMLYEEMHGLKEQIKTLMQENSELRHASEKKS